MKVLKIIIPLVLILGLSSCGDDVTEVSDVAQVDEQALKDKKYCEDNSTKVPYAGGDGSPETPFKICTAIQFNNISDTSADHDKNFELNQDIDFSGVVLKMISDSASGFSGVFDGKGYSLKNISLSHSGIQYIGVFKKVAVDGVVKNLSLDNINIVGSHYVGAIAGYSSGRIENCKSSGVITGGNNTGGLVGRVWGTASAQEGVYNSSSSATITGGQWTGGIVGWSRNAKFENSFATGNITSGNRSGGLVGVADGTIEIINCYSTGNVSGTGFLIGGIVGGIVGNITSSYSTGSVSATNGYVGGIAGSLNGVLSKSYSTASVSLTGSSCAGGLVGYHYSGGEIKNSYFAGAVNTALDYVGGIVGYNDSSPINYSFSVSTSLTGNDPGGIQGGSTIASAASSFWDSESSSITGDFIDDMVTKSTDQARTTLELKTAATFTSEGYDPAIWNIVDGEFPTLK